MAELTQERLKQILRYDPETGTMYWRSGRNFGQSAGSVDHKGYVHIRIFGKMYLRSRLVFLYMEGVWPKEVDHRNRCPIDDRWKNLRCGNRSRNMQNMSLPVSNVSGYKGVSRRSSGRYRAYITVMYKKKMLGTFDTKEEALAARKAAERELGWWNDVQSA